MFHLRITLKNGAIIKYPFLQSIAISNAMDCNCCEIFLFLNSAGPNTKVTGLTYLIIPFCIMVSGYFLDFLNKILLAALPPVHLL
ncbi:hypothetical protein CRD36_00445 [Paremcibacter congregatus]|uniref:Uncharacterized protein n=1 Tax=Paremcibacter congregatus TaxID=2043170 RepID=A0A2G4YVL6_9PROT|nr:hypothetical protein CRD36_00445 [Paremcibacter congregatus]